MRYITQLIKKYILPIQIITSIIFFLIVYFALRCDSQNHQQELNRRNSTESTITQLQSDNAALQQDNTALRAEIERMKKEPSRSGNRRVMEISYYSPAADENGGYDGTSSGAPLTVGRTIAANNLPFGTRVFIPGIGWRVVEDRGDLEDNQLDILCATKEEAFARGRHMAQVVIER